MNCGLVLHRDVSAACVIRDRGLPPEPGGNAYAAPNGFADGKTAGGYCRGPNPSAGGGEKAGKIARGLLGTQGDYSQMACRDESTKRPENTGRNAVGPTPQGLCRSRGRRMSLWRRPIREIRPARLHGSSGRGSVFQKPRWVRRRGGRGAENTDILKEIRLHGCFGGEMAGIAESRLAGAARIVRGKSARTIRCAAGVRRSARSPVPRIPPAAICEGGG